MKVRGRIRQVVVTGEISQVIVRGRIEQLVVRGEVAQAGTDNVAPVLLSAVVEDATPNVITLTYDIALDESSVPDYNIFTLYGNYITGISISGKTVILTCQFDFLYGESFSLDYVKQLAYAPYIKSTCGIAAEDFTGFEGINNTLPVG